MLVQRGSGPRIGPGVRDPLFFDYARTLSIKPVPEPGTWALMVARRPGELANPEAPHAPIRRSNGACLRPQQGGKLSRNEAG